MTGMAAEFTEPDGADSLPAIPRPRVREFREGLQYVAALISLMAVIVLLGAMPD
jgi:hypothetical protein